MQAGAVGRGVGRRSCATVVVEKRPGFPGGVIYESTVLCGSAFEDNVRIVEAHALADRIVFGNGFERPVLGVVGIQLERLDIEPCLPYPFDYVIDGIVPAMIRVGPCRPARAGHSIAQVFVCIL